MDENRVIRIILEARDGISGVMANVRKNVRKDLDELDKSFIDSRKQFNLYERDVDHVADSLTATTKEVDKATLSVNKMTQALKNARIEARRGKTGIIGVVQDIKGEVSGRRTVRGAGGRIMPGKGKEPGDFVLYDNAKKVKVISQDIRTVLAQGYRIARDTQRDLDKALGSTKEIRKEKEHELKEKNHQDKINLSIAQDRRRADEANIVEEKTRNSGLLEEQLDNLKKLHRAKQKYEKDQTEESLAEMHKLEKEDGFIQNRINQIKRNVSTERTRAFAQERKDLARNFNLAMSNARSLSKEDAKREIEKFRQRRADLLSSGTRRDRITKRIGFSFGDFFGGIGRGRSDARDLDQDLEKLSSTFGRLGFAIGGAFKDLNSFVNLRWLFITSAITLLVNVLTQLVVVLVSVVSSAILAALALGSALVAGVTQAIPVVGLLAAAFHSLTKAMDAVKLQEKASIKSANDQKEAADKKRQANQRLADAHYAVKQAIQSVLDAQYNLEQSNKDVEKSIDEQKEAQKDLADARKKAAQDIIDANLKEKDSALALKEAELGVLQAKEKLRLEESKGRKSSVDIAQAQAAVREAQDRLNLAKQQADNPEIILASQQLSFAQQNLSSIQDAVEQNKNDFKEAQLDVKRAELTRKQAVNRKKKDQIEANDLRNKGVAGADIVVNAEKALAQATEDVATAQHNVAESQRSVADATHSVAIAKREEADARRDLADSTKLQTTAQKNLAEAVADLSPAEKRLYKSLVRIKAAYKAVFSGTPTKDGLLAPIIDGFTAISEAILKLLKDPEIIKALSDLAKSIGAGLGRLAKEISSAEFKDNLLFFIKESTNNLPTVFDILIKIKDVIMEIGRAGSGIFKDVLEGVDSLLNRADKWITGTSSGKQKRPEEGTRGTTGIKEENNLERFLRKAGEHLDTWIALSGAIINVISALTNVSAPTGQSLLERATDALNALAKYINENPEEVADFFERISHAFVNLSNSLLGLIKIFGKVAADENVQAFALFLIDTIVPGIYLMISAVGLFARGLNALTEIPVFGKIVKWAVAIAIAEKSLNKLFPVTQGLTNILRQGLIKTFGVLAYVITKPTRALESFKVALQLSQLAIINFGKSVAKIGPAIAGSARELVAFVKAFRALAATEGIIVALTAAFPALGAAIGTAFTLATGPVGLIILAIIAVGTALFLLDKKFHFIRPTIEFFWKHMKSIFDWIKNHWRLVVALLTGPIGVAVLLIIKHWGKIKDLFFGFSKLLIKFFFKPVYNILIKPFVEAQKFIISLWKKLPGVLGDIIKKIPGLKTLLKIAGKIGGFFGKVVGGVAGVVGGSVKGAGGRVGRAADAADTALGGTHTKKISPSRVINNDAKDIKLIKRLKAKGMSDPEILDWLIQHGAISKANFKKRFGFPLSAVQGYAIGGYVSGIGTGDTVPAMLTPGEWVLNKKQQKNLGKKIGAHPNKIANMLFGGAQHFADGGIVQKFGLGGIVKDLKTFFGGGGTDQPLLPFSQGKPQGRVTNKAAMDMLRQMTFAITGADSLSEFQRKPGIMKGISAAISLPIFFGRGYSAGKSGTKTIKSLKSLEKIANETSNFANENKSTATIKELLELVNKAPEYKDGMKVKKGRLYNVYLPKIQYTYGIEDRLAVVQDPRNGVMFATSGGLAHHGDIMNEASKRGYHFALDKNNFPITLQHEVRGRSKSRAVYSGELGEIKSIDDTVHPGAISFRGVNIKDPLKSKDTRSATIGRMRLLRDLHEAGFDVGAFVRKTRESIKPTLKGGLDENTLKAFGELASQQRGAPEKAMLEVQHAMGGGVASNAAEHIGDIIHRMNEWAGKSHGTAGPNFGKEFTKPKVERMYDLLTSRYGFSKEFEENIVSNAIYHKIPVPKYREDVYAALAKYADEHRKLPVYNKAQWLAREAAVSLGERKFSDTKLWLGALKDIVESPEYGKLITEFKKSPDGKLLHYPYPEPKKFSKGVAGVPGTGTGDTVKAMLTPGEWVLNKDQLRKLQSVTGMSLQQLKAQVFGTNIIKPGNPGVLGTAGSKLKPSKRHSPILGGSYNLIPQEDADSTGSDGKPVTVWFLQLADGTFGQVTQRDADKITATKGAFIPNYVKRNAHGFSQRIRTEMNPLGFANGGIVPSAMRGFASGGVVQAPGFGNSSSKNTQVHQNFNVKTEGATDWSYVMRLSAITAQSAF